MKHHVFNVQNFTNRKKNLWSHVECGLILNDITGLIEYGASPRASINIVLASKARAFMEHRGYITPEDVRFVGMDVLRHRVILTYEAEAEELSSEDIIQRLFETIEVP